MGSTVDRDISMTDWDRKAAAIKELGRSARLNVALLADRQMTLILELEKRDKASIADLADLAVHFGFRVYVLKMRTRWMKLVERKAWGKVVDMGEAGFENEHMRRIAVSCQGERHHVLMWPDGSTQFEDHGREELESARILSAMGGSRLECLDTADVIKAFLDRWKSDSESAHCFLSMNKGIEEDNGETE